MAMLRHKQVEQVIQNIDPTARLHKGKGYFYFTGDSVERAPTTMVCLHKLNQATLEQWVRYFNQIRASAQR